MNGEYYHIKSRAYSTRHSVLALLALLFGCFIGEHLPIFCHPTVAFLSIFIFMAASLLVVKRQNGRLSKRCLICSLVVTVLACGTMISGASGVISIAFISAIALICYMVSAEHGNKIEDGFSNYILLDILRAFLLPYRALIAVFDALFNGFTAKGTAYIGKILLGIVLAAVPTVIITALLSFDSSFITVLENMFTFSNIDPFANIPQICIGIFTGMYLFGLFIAAKAGYHKGTLSAQDCRARLAQLKIMPQITALAASLPILFIYVVFFISQWDYYISGFTGNLPESFSYAQYAREGFFQLCTVSLINLIILIALTLFSRRGLSGKAPVLKLLSVMFCIFTLVLIATAVAKLVMYIHIYGMTQKRLYAMWGMIAIGLVFIITAVGQFMPRFKTVTVCLCVVAVLFGMLCICDTNALIARYNADRYLSGTLQRLDVDAMEDLGASAVPAMAYILENADPDPRKPLPKDLSQILSYLLNISDEYSQGESSFLNYNIPDYLAMHALQELGLLK